MDRIGAADVYYYELLVNHTANLMQVIVVQAVHFPSNLQSTLIVFDRRSPSNPEERQIGHLVLIILAH